MHKSIAKENQVARIINNFDSAEITNWASNNQDLLTSGSFAEFIVKLKKKFLLHNWEDDLVQCQISTQGQTSFEKWVNNVRKANSELGAASSAYFIKDSAFRRHIIPRLTPELCCAYDTQNVRVNDGTKGSLDAIADLEAWLERINILDLDLQARRVELQALQTKPKSMRPTTTNFTQNITPNGGTQSLNTTIVPKLTPEERSLLMTHQGCLKCRCFYAGHFTDKCPVD
jgi:hypothetical protein